ncbi:MAG: hypothetical protein FJ405_12250, partial [Verrucomicrobia bacterium]|nr:hypothetical protein [Verrucomicrobiota bacterium]
MNSMNRPILNHRCRMMALQTVPASITVLLACWVALLSSTRPVLSQQQFQGVCSRVKMEIAQELTLERIGFEATLEVTDNDSQDPITDFFAELTFENPDTTNGVPVDASSLFFVRAPTFENINSIDGSGVIAPTTKAVIRWFIIPKIAAGGTSPAGQRYRVGCKLAGKIRGTTIPGDVLFAVPDTITVKPEPQLEITYFQPRDVQGDDPFTEEMESPIPFTLGVLVKNVGHGPARKLRIDSKQPKITENINGLLLVAQLLGSRVMDAPQRSPSLLVDLGDILPGQTRKGAWDMITSLSGEFVDFRASYRHASELGGEETSVIVALNAHFIAREVLNNEPGRDAIKDFLADTDRDADLYPDSLYESEGGVQPVNLISDVQVIGSVGAGGSFDLLAAPDIDGWCYFRVPDPGQARLRIASVVRSDGKVINTNNVWTNIRYTRLGNVRQNWLNIFDRVDLTSYTYRVTYQSGGPDTVAPVTGIYFAGPSTQNGNTYFITPATQIYFISEDINPVSIVYSLTNSPFIPALPFSLPNPGSYLISYFATDSAGNKEAPNTKTLVVAGDASLEFGSIQSPVDPIYVPGDALSVRPSQAPIQFRMAPNPAETAAKLDIFQGVVGWVSISNVPPSPTPGRTASIRVSGENVDFYRFRLNNGLWSEEQPVASLLSLSNLANGQQTLSVLGRSRFGSFLGETQSVTLRWTIDPAAPPLLVSGVPATPSRQRSAALTIGGPGVTHYRWTIHNGFFRAETPIATPLTLPSLEVTQQVVSIVGKIGGAFPALSAAQTVSWITDPLHGYQMSSLQLVQSTSFTNISTNLISYTWDGRDNTGAIVTPGWYTVRVTLTDELGKTNFATRLVQVGNLSGDPQALASALRGPRNPHARGRWSVWQDQSDGFAQIYARDLTDPSAQIQKLTSGILSQESPKTDGRHVVWQGRQTNANWDIYIKDLQSPGAPRRVTETPAQDEINPCVEWPWVVFQSRPAGSTSAPWQLRAYNAVSGDTAVVSASSQDEIDPDIQDGRVVWQDFRNVGFGEIYFRHLETGEFRRITTNIFGQYAPVIHDRWIVWQDNRNGQVDLY